MRRMKAAWAAVWTLCALLAACQGRPEIPAARPDNRAAIRLLQEIHMEARNCWRGDRDFEPYRIVPELDTHFGKPRILLVKAEAPQGLPQLVVEAEGTPARLNTYGPLAGEKLAGRIRSDLDHWSRGGKGCEARA